MFVLGVNAYHGEASACLVQDGRVVFAAEEERYTRLKYTAGFPAHSIRACLAFAGLSPADLDHFAVARAPRAHLPEKVLYALRRRPRPDMIRNSVARMRRARGAETELAAALDCRPDELRARVHHVEHHVAHCASAFLPSGFEESAVMSVDGFGDYLSALFMDGRGGRMRRLGQVTFPHSVGALYTAITQYCGFVRYGDEWKLMGLAPYGRPVYADEIRRMIRPTRRGYELDLRYFVHHRTPVYQNWDGLVPTQEIMYSPYLVQRLGPARPPGDPLTAHYQDVACSVQVVVEEVLFRLLDALHRATGQRRLCLAGGVALNSVFNGKIQSRTPFGELFVQPAASDAGLSLGAALYVSNVILNQRRTYTMEHAYLGAGYPDDAIGTSLAQAGLPAVRLPEEELTARTARLIADGQIVGWFQGRTEFGPRALGNRSIVVDPRRPEMKDILNERIKRRETFRPFAPSVLVEATGEWFERSEPDPFMLKVYPIRPEKRAQIPAVTHVDGTGRLQTVDRRTNPRYWALIAAFERATGVPLVLNTSFNENEPIVNTPQEAIDCFRRTQMDALVLGSYLITRDTEAARRETRPEQAAHV